jgi:CO/xanthine dehydrogenase FAD-binding subunit
MITEYLRPGTLEEAIELLGRKDPLTLPLGGGSVLSKSHAHSIAVVDLQSLRLNQLLVFAEKIEIGATATLSEIETTIDIDELKTVIRLQAGKNQRNSGTLAGLVNVADGRSPLLTFLLALDTQLVWEPGNKTISLAEWLPQRGTWHEARLITKVLLPKADVGFDLVARTPKDLPLVVVAVARWASGRMRVAVGGFGPLPLLALDGNDLSDAAKAVDYVLTNSEDMWATADYRRTVGKVLTARLVSEVKQSAEERII